MKRNLDLEIVDWIGRLGAAGINHVMEHFGIGRCCAQKRLRQLTTGGLLVQHRILVQRPALYAATRQGLRWCRLDGLNVLKVCATQFEHGWRIADAAVALAAAPPDWQVLSEREIRWRERERRELLASARVGSRAGDVPALHGPDLALLSPTGRVVAIEVELSVKVPRALVTICNGWARARHVDAVYYLASPRAARAVGRAVKKTHAEDWITILPLGQTAEVLRLERAAAAGAGGGDTRAAGDDAGPPDDDASAGDDASARGNDEPR